MQSRFWLRHRKLRISRPSRPGRRLWYNDSMSVAILTIRVTPRAKRNAVARAAAGQWKVFVTAPPEDGRANEAVLELLADQLGVRRRQLRLLSGEKSRQKVVAIDAPPFDVIARLGHRV
jgi:uncharacterized protein (TIGR00251 family)